MSRNIARILWSAVVLVLVLSAFVADYFYFYLPQQKPALAMTVVDFPKASFSLPDYFPGKRFVTKVESESPCGLTGKICHFLTLEDSRYLNGISVQWKVLDDELFSMRVVKGQSFTSILTVYFVDSGSLLDKFRKSRGISTKKVLTSVPDNFDPTKLSKDTDVIVMRNSVASRKLVVKFSEVWAVYEQQEKELKWAVATFQPHKWSLVDSPDLPG